MRKQILKRLGDLVVLAMLIGPHQDAKTFAAVLVSIMVILALLGALGMTADLANQLLLGQPKRTFYVRVIFGALYCPALIYGGYPVLAALYAIAVCLFFEAARVKLGAQEKP